MKRREAILASLAAGCTPIHTRNDPPLGFTQVGRIWVSNDYWKFGGIRMPIGLEEARAVLAANHARFPTKQEVDMIWEAAHVKLRPQPLPWGPEMTTQAYFERHDAMIEEQLDGRTGLIAGHKKDILGGWAPTDRDRDGAVTIYGWHRSSGVPIQPVHSGHSWDYADYSHGLRLVLIN